MPSRFVSTHQVAGPQPVAQNAAEHESVLAALQSVEPALSHPRRESTPGNRLDPERGVGCR
ncbi:MAG: hypothetical protein H0W96_04630 [Solirubrobacterales bacterium]|nr:hypothetical protein [Solirubrobacterales bacterium]